MGKQAHVREAARRKHDREYARMNERRPGKRVKAGARGVLRRVARYALAPLSLARAVVDRFRDRG